MFSVGAALQSCKSAFFQKSNEMPIFLHRKRDCCEKSFRSSRSCLFYLGLTLLCHFYGIILFYNPAPVLHFSSQCLPDGVGFLILPQFLVAIRHGILCVQKAVIQSNGLFPVPEGLLILLLFSAKTTGVNVENPFLRK